MPRNTKKSKKQIEIYSHTKVKGTMPQDFRLLVLFMIQFPQAPEYPIRAVSNLFENLRRYLQLKVHLPPRVINTGGK